MAKHAFTALFLFIFTGFTTAQLTLQQVNGTKKRVIPVGTSIDLTFPNKTSGQPHLAFHKYGGKLKNVTSNSIDLVLTYENAHFMNENGVKIQQYRYTKQPDTPMITQMPLNKLQSITVLKDKNRKISDASFFVFSLAVLSNIFIAPHLKAPYNKTVRNAGYVVMGVGLSVAFIPTRRTYYLEQPKDGSKTLWKLVN